LRLILLFPSAYSPGARLRSSCSRERTLRSALLLLEPVFHSSADVTSDPPFVQLTFRQSTPRKGKAGAAAKAPAKARPKAPKGGRNLADPNNVFAADEPWEDDFYFGGDLDITEVDLAEVLAAPTRQPRTSVGSVRSIEEMPPPAAPQRRAIAAAPRAASGSSTPRGDEQEPVSKKAKLQALRTYRAEVGFSARPSSRLKRY
jgi:hypothetical protein